MEGAALAATRAADLAIVTAWHTAVFALNGYAGKLKNKSLSDFLSSDFEKPQKSDAASAAAFFHGLKLKGYDVKTERVIH